jgi:hypothetical protein
MDLCPTPAVELARLIRGRELSAAELLSAVLARITEANPSVNAIVTLAAEQATATARGLDAQAARGSFAGPLHGLPIAVRTWPRRRASGPPSARRCSPRTSPTSTRRTWPCSSRPARW